MSHKWENDDDERDVLREIDAYMRSNCNEEI